MRLRPQARAFTLIELLVVVAIISLLMSILLPSLAHARAQSRLVVCESNLRQIGIGIAMYADSFGGCIPRGPTPLNPYDLVSSAMATSQVWIGVAGVFGPAAHPREYLGLGVEYASTMNQARILYCPTDAAHNLPEELPKIGTDQDAYSSYLYRQLDYLPAGFEQGKLDHLGAHDIGKDHIPVAALALDMVSRGVGTMAQNNHDGQWVNLLFADLSVARLRNTDDVLALPAQAFVDFSRVPQFIDQLLSNADYAKHWNPRQAPRLPGM